VLKDINSRKLEEKGCVHGRNKLIIRGYIACTFFRA